MATQKSFGIRRAERKRIKLKLSISGPSGGGKTYGALKVAHGLCGDWEKICVIDTENGTSELYSDLGPFNVLLLDPPYTPERYNSAITEAIRAGMEVVIVDSLSHQWMGEGGVLEAKDQLGGRFTDWKKLSPRHRSTIQLIADANVHIIATMRTKTEWAIDTDDKGKPTPRRVGVKSEQRDGVEFEFTIGWRVDPHNNLATCDKDRTGLFMGKPERRLDESFGQELRRWAETGSETPADKLRAAFAGIGVTAEQLTRLCGGRSVEALTPEAIENLRKLFPRLRDKEVTVDQLLAGEKAAATSTEPKGQMPAAELDEVFG